MISTCDVTGWRRHLNQELLLLVVLSKPLKLVVVVVVVHYKNIIVMSEMISATTEKRTDLQSKEKLSRLQRNNYKMNPWLPNPEPSSSQNNSYVPGVVLFCTSFIFSNNANEKVSRCMQRSWAHLKSGGKQCSTHSAVEKIRVRNSNILKQ